MRPAKGVPAPCQGKNGPLPESLAGTREIVAKLTDSSTGEEVHLVDWYGVSKKKLNAEERQLYDRLLQERWTGSASFMKGSVSSRADDACITASKTVGESIPEWVVRLRTTPGWHVHGKEKLLMTRGPLIPENFDKQVAGKFDRYCAWTHSNGNWTCIGINMERSPTQGKKYTIPAFRIGVLLDRSITNVAILFKMSDDGGERQVDEPVVVTASRVLAAQSKLKGLSLIHI